jgi:hypothetical protein
MHSPSKIKTNKDIIKRTIINQQLLEGAWVLEPKPRPNQFLKDIIVQGQSMPPNNVFLAGVNQAKKQRRSELKSAKGRKEKPKTQSKQQTFIDNEILKRAKNNKSTEDSYLVDPNHDLDQPRQERPKVT